MYDTKRERRKEGTRKRKKELPNERAKRIGFGRNGYTTKNNSVSPSSTRGRDGPERVCGVGREEEEFLFLDTKGYIQYNLYERSMVVVGRRGFFLLDHEEIIKNSLIPKNDRNQGKFWNEAAGHSHPLSANVPCK